jgi:hypothetical protein
MIRNNASQQMTVLPVLRSRTGTETNLEPVSIAPNASQSVSVADALTRVAPSILSDADAYGSVVFRYNSVSAGHIYAGTVVGRTGSPVMFHFDAAKSVPEFTSGSYQSIWWRPTKEDTGTLVLTNLGDRDIQGNIRLLDAKGRSTTHTFAIGRRQTQQVSLTELLSKDGLEGEFGGVAIEPQNSPGNLQVLQFTLNQTTGLGVLLKVFPKSVLAEKQFTIRASMVAMAHPDPALALPAETRLQPRIFLYNSTEHPIIAHLLVDWHSATDWGRKPVPDLTIAPGATQILSLAESDEQQLGIPTTATWGSVEISYASDDGDLVALEASPSTDAKYLVQTPFTDAISFQFKGGAWMADADHTALITAGNAGAKPAKLDFKLWFGTPTPYEFPVKTLQPGEAITVNVGGIITNQQPDRNGKTIPLSVTSGTYEFSDLADPYVGYLYEGKQQIDKTYGLATYGCAFCCYYDYGWIATFTGHPGDSGPIPATGEEDCQNNYYDYDITSSVTGWASSNSNVATVSPGLAHAVGVGQASSSGSANLRSYQSYKSCPLAPLAVGGLLQVLGPPPPTISGPQTVWWFNGQNPSGYGTSITLQSSGGSSTTWSVSGNTAAVHLSTTSGASTTVTASSTVWSATEGDVQITATANGQSSQPFAITTRKPYKLVAGTIQHTCDTTYGYSDFLNYTIDDQLSAPLPSGIPINENWTTGVVADYSGANWRRIDPGKETTSGPGFADQIAGEAAGFIPTAVCSGSGVKVQHWGQDWYVGSLTLAAGVRVQSDVIQKYIDHALHQSIVSPSP